MYYLSPEELNLVLRFVNDEGEEVLKSDVPQRLTNIYAAFCSRMGKVVAREHSRAVRAETTVERLRNRLYAKGEEGEFRQLGFSVMDVALCIVYLLKEKNFYYGRNIVQYILYFGYSRWLANHHERMFEEQPVAQEWGPHWWAISKKCTGVPPVTTYDDFKRIAERNSGVAAFLRNLVAKYGTWSEEDMKNVLLDSFPYKNAMAKKTAADPALQKWGRVIKDSDIFVWRNGDVK